MQVIEAWEKIFETVDGDGTFVNGNILDAGKIAKQPQQMQVGSQQHRPHSAHSWQYTRTAPVCWQSRTICTGHQPHCVIGASCQRPRADIRCCWPPAQIETYSWQTAHILQCYR